MAKISELPDAAPLTGDELIPVVQDGQTRRASANNLRITPETPEFIEVIWRQVSTVADPINATNIEFIQAGSSGS